MANQTGDRGFNTVQNSSVAKRERSRAMQKYTIFGVIALAALTVLMLLVMAIGGIIANIRGEIGKGPDNEKVDWASRHRKCPLRGGPRKECGRQTIRGPFRGNSL